MLGLRRFSVEHIAAARSEYFMPEAFAHAPARGFKEFAIGAGLAFLSFFYVLNIH
jgi:hypothetical protein